jgi:hypothetical protein
VYTVSTWDGSNHPIHHFCTYCSYRLGLIGMKNPLRWRSKWWSTAKEIAIDSRTSSGVTAIHIFCIIVGFLVSTSRSDEIVYDKEVFDMMKDAIKSQLVLQVSFGCSCVCIPLIIDYFLDAVRLSKQVNFNVSQWNLLLSVIAPCVVYYIAVMSGGSASVGNVCNVLE